MTLKGFTTVSWCRYLLIVFALLQTACAQASEPAIVVHVDREGTKVPAWVFGSNFLGYEPKTYEKNFDRDFYGYTDYGSGVWDPVLNAPVDSTMQLARDIKMSAIRFPGGVGANRYDWRRSVGAGREHFLFGLDEFLTVTSALNAEPVFTIGYYVNDENDAADLVAYANLSGKGHRLTYFEIGNEIYLNEKVTPEEYAERYLRYYSSMKEKDPSVQIGAVFEASRWDARVLNKIGGKIDFGIIHIYPYHPPTDTRQTITELPPDEIYRAALTHGIDGAEKKLHELSRLLKEKSGRPIPLAVTEFNGGFPYDKPRPYRHALGTALVNAELLRIFMKPESHVLMANYWQYCNSWWGMVSNGFEEDPIDLYRPYTKYPNYFVFEMYAKHFGEFLVPSEVSVSDLSVNASKSADGRRIYLMVVNKNMKTDITAVIELKGAIPTGHAKAWILNGPGVESNNLEKTDTVAVKNIDFQIKKMDKNASNSFTFTFEPHSLTAIELDFTLSHT